MDINKVSKIYTIVTGILIILGVIISIYTFNWPAMCWSIAAGTILILYRATAVSLYRTKKALDFARTIIDKKDDQINKLHKDLDSKLFEIDETNTEINS